MKLRKIVIKNIRSYTEQKINFPEGSLLLAGDVGAGKTTILLAIEYALFGLGPGQSGAALLSNDKNAGSVLLEFEIDGKEILIERRLRRSPKSILNEYACISINGQKKEYSVTELKTKVLGLLGYPLEFVKRTNLLYKYTVYTPQEQMKQIITEDPQVRLNVLRHVFGIDKYKLIRENLAIAIGKIKDEMKVLQGEIKDIEKDAQTIENEKASLAVTAEKIKAEEKELENKMVIRKNLEEEIKSVETDMKGRDKLETELEKTQVMIATKEDNLFSVKREIAELKKALGEEVAFNDLEFKNTLSQILAKRIELDRMNTKRIELMSQLKNLEKSLEALKEKKSRVFSINICPTCLQDVPQVHKHNILNETEGAIVKVKRDIEDIALEKDAIINALDREKLDFIQLEERKIKLEVLKSKQEIFKKTKARFEELVKIQGSLEGDITMLNKHSEVIKQDMLKYSRFDSIYKIKKENLKLALNEEKREEILLAELKKEAELKILELTNLRERLQLKENSRNRLNKILDIFDWLNNKFLSLVDFTERNVMMKLRSEFSQLFRKWFALLGGESFEARLDENFTPIIMQGGVEMDYSFLSGGERTAVALAYRLALNQTINSVISQIKTRDIVILDEPTEGFSEAQIEKIRDVFTELNMRQIIIVSHEQKIEGLVGNIIKVKKEDGASVAEELTSIF